MAISTELKTIKFCGIELVNMTRKEFASFIIERSREFKSYISFSLNGESLAKFHHDDEFKEMFLKADFVHADGMSIVTGSRLVLKHGLPERIATTDWFHDVAELSEDEGITHYFLGAVPQRIEQMINNVRLMYPRLNIVGYHHGYFSKEEEDDLINKINSLKPGIIWLGLGRPKQEQIALRLKNECEVGIIKTCGGLFNFLSGTNARAPKAIQNMGFEWLYRLSLEPTRLFKRYLVTNFQSVGIIIKYLFVKGNT